MFHVWAPESPCVFTCLHDALCHHVQNMHLQILRDAALQEAHDIVLRAIISNNHMHLQTSHPISNHGGHCDSICFVILCTTVGLVTACLLAWLLRVSCIVTVFMLVLLR